MSTELPLLYVLGDSVSLHYGPYLEEALQGTFRYARKTAEDVASVKVDIPPGPNGGDSNRVVLFLRGMIERGDFWPDVLLVNCGLHDLRRTVDTNKLQVDEEAYRANLREIISLARTIGAKLVWALCTPIFDDHHNGQATTLRRFNADVEIYNRIAMEEMSAAGVPMVDLYAFTRTLESDPAILLEDHVHYAVPAREQQGRYLARWLLDWHAGAREPAVSPR